MNNLLAHLAPHIHPHPEDILWALAITIAAGLLCRALKGRAK